MAEDKIKRCLCKTIKKSMKMRTADVFVFIFSSTLLYLIVRGVILKFLKFFTPHGIL